MIIIWEHNNNFFILSLIVCSNVELKLIGLLHGASVKWEIKTDFFFSFFHWTWFNMVNLTQQLCGEWFRCKKVWILQGGHVQFGTAWWCFREVVMDNRGILEVTQSSPSLLALLSPSTPLLVVLAKWKTCYGFKTLLRAH